MIAYEKMVNQHFPAMRNILGYPFDEFEWRAMDVQPGTYYEDEPGVEVQAGWHILGMHTAAHPEESVVVDIPLGFVADYDGYDAGEKFAKHLVELLRGGLRMPEVAE